MSEILEATDLTQPGLDGWKVEYRVKRDDGEVVRVHASLTRTAEETIRNTGSDEAIAAADDRCQAAALKYANHAQSPGVRGEVTVTLWFDTLGGSLRKKYDYEKQVPES